jgi:hypothetical protein
MQRQPPRKSQLQDSGIPKAWIVAVGAIALFGTTVWTVRYLLDLLSPPPASPPAAPSPRPQISLQPYLVQPASPPDTQGKPAAKLAPTTTEPGQAASVGKGRSSEESPPADQRDSGSAPYSRQDDSTPRPVPRWESQVAPSPARRRWRPRSRSQPTAPPIVPVAPPIPPPQPAEPPVSTQTNASDKQFNVRWPNRKREESYDTLTN